MFSDSINHNAVIPCAAKDSGKKKRTHRSARLKQYKRDARREQWLSQGAVKQKGRNDDASGPRFSPPACNVERKNLETRGKGEEENDNGPIHHDFDSDSNSPTGSSVLGSTDAGTTFTGSSSSSSSSAGCCSGNITEDEEGVGDDNCLEDWEAMADALASANESKQESQNDGHCSEGSESSGEQHEPVTQVQASYCNVGFTWEHVKQECPRTVALGLAHGNRRAWRPDDEFRPQSLPNLSKQRSFPNTERHYGQGGLPWVCSSAANVPSSCPICYEDLDVTDTSFLPCLCGFRLCLFCHKRILEEDGRCPGCRKPYKRELVEAEASVPGGCLNFRLARSCSMITRS